MTRKLICAFILLFFLVSCHRNTGMYTPSFEGIQSVSAPGQWVHSTNFIPFIGKYVNYSPYKNVGVFVDARANHFKPQVSGAVGYYLANYEKRTYINQKKEKVTKRIGGHIDSYIGFGFQRGLEHFDDVGTIQRDYNPIDYSSYRTFGQVGFHWNGSALMMNVVYRWNRMDVEKIIYYNSNAQITNYVENIVALNPISLHELQGMVGMGNDRLKCNLVVNIVIPNNSIINLNYSKFNQVQFGLSYILDTFDSN